MLQPLDGPPPLWEDVQAAWRRLRVTPRCAVGHAYLDRLAGAYVNGRVELLAFDLDAPPALAWTWSREHGADVGWASRLLETVAAREPDTAIFRGLDLEAAKFERLSSFLFPGTLAWVLHEGGAYPADSAPTPAEAMSLADDLRRAIFADRYDEVLIAEAHTPWSDFFHGVAWDHSWLLLDKRHSRLNVLAATDTD